jgi:hypothetical protein
VAALAAAVPLAAAMDRILVRHEGTPERGAVLVALLCAVAALIPPAALLIARRRAASPARLALVLLATIVGVLAAIDLFWLAGVVRFPADILIWSESDFVNDIIKLRVGYPLYSPQANNDSFVYTPGSQLLTYALASLVGGADSMPVLRGIQLGYVVLAAVVGALCVRRLLVMAAPERPIPGRGVWAALWLPALFLIATNAVTNAYAPNLHNDALALLVSAVAYWLLLEYAGTRDRRLLIAMALVPAAGFLVKQSLALWAGLYVAYLLLFDRPLAPRRVALFAAAALGGVALAVAVGLAIWGEDFHYWAIVVLGAHGVFPLRSVQHLLEAWEYFAVGIAAALVLLRGAAAARLLGVWLVWLALLAAETYTSGVAWMLNHMGPGSLIAGVWLLAGATRLWADALDGAAAASPVERWLRPAGAMAIGALLLSGLGVVRLPRLPIPTDAMRYVRDIEAEFAGVPAGDILLDAGSWLYARDGVVMKDRAPTIGERGWSATGDFSQTLRRIETQRYRKVLVRNLHVDDFWYDHATWRRPSGIRQALLTHYREVRTIPKVEGQGERERYLFAPITVLVPREGAR